MSSCFPLCCAGRRGVRSWPHSWRQHGELPRSIQGRWTGTRRMGRRSAQPCCCWACGISWWAGTWSSAGPGGRGSGLPSRRGQLLRRGSRHCIGISACRGSVDAGGSWTGVSVLFFSALLFLAPLMYVVSPFLSKLLGTADTIGDAMHPAFLSAWRSMPKMWGFLVMFGTWTLITGPGSPLIGYVIALLPAAAFCLIGMSLLMSDAEARR